MQKRFRQVFTALREHSSMNYAKIAMVGGFCNVELIIIKATAPDDLPLPEKYIQELLKIFSISPSSLRDFLLSFARRFGKTHCWRVALKCLILLHRLLRSVPEDSNFRSELLWAQSNGLMSLNQCHFRDDSSSASDYYSAFIRSYAQLLDEALHCYWLDSKPTYDQQEQRQYEEYREQEEEYEEEGKEEEEPEFESLSNRMMEVGRMLEVLPQLQTLIDLVIDCRPTGPAAKAFLVQLAMKHIIRDSLMCYTIFRSEIVTVLDSLFQMPYRSCILAFGIYKKAAVQASQLSEFYEWCKAMGLCGSYEYPFVDQIPHIQIHALENFLNGMWYPFVDQIPHIQIHALENFLNGMWQLTESPSTPTSPTSSASVPSSLVDFSSTSTLTEDDIKYFVFMSQKDHILVSTQWEKSLIQFKREGYDKELLLIQFDEEKPLIEFEDDIVDESWESLLDASINKSPAAETHQNNVWQMQIYNPNDLNPFHDSISQSSGQITMGTITFAVPKFS